MGFGRTFVRLSLGLVAAALVMLAVFAAVCPHAAIAAPAGWQISQLTTSTGSHHPDTDGKWLVWLSGSEVMARDLSTGEVHQLSNDGTSKSDPLVNDDTVIWSATTSGALHGYLYHLSSGPLQDLGVIPDTPVSYDAGRFAYRKQVSGQLMHAVYVYDLTTRLSTLITNSGDDPSLRGSYLAYANEDSTGWSLRLLDLTTAQGVKISTNQTPVSRVNLSDSYVVWALDSSDTMEIYLLDRATNKVQRITNDSYEDREPKAAGNLIVWESLRPDWEVMVYNVSTGQTLQLTDNDTRDMLPCTDGSKVYWQGEVGAGLDYQLFMAEPATVSERPFVDVPPDHYYEPAIDGLYRLTIIDGHRIVEGKRYYDPDEPDHAKNLRIAEYNGLLDRLEGFGPSWNPEAPADRAECAQFMWNYLKLAGVGM